MKLTSRDHYLSTAVPHPLARALVEAVNKINSPALEKALTSISEIDGMMPAEWFLRVALKEGVHAMADRVAKNGGHILIPFRFEVAEGKGFRSSEAEDAMDGIAPIVSFKAAGA